MLPRFTPGQCACRAETIAQGLLPNALFPPHIPQHLSCVFNRQYKHGEIFLSRQYEVSCFIIFILQKISGDVKNLKTK